VATGVGGSRASGGWFNSGVDTEGRDWGDSGMSGVSGVSGVKEDEDDAEGEERGEEEGGRVHDDAQGQAQGQGQGRGRKPSRMVVQDAHRWGGRYALAQSKLYVVIHDVCGQALSSLISQQCLSLLAACPSVALLACVENLNSLVLWDRSMLANFHWSFEHAPSYRSFRLPQDHPFFTTEVPTEAETETETIVQAEVGEGQGEEAEGEGVSAPAGSVGTSVGTAPVLSRQSGAAPKASDTARGAPPRSDAPVGIISRKAAVTQQSMDVILQSLTKTHNELMEVLLDCIRQKEQLRLAAVSSSSSSSSAAASSSNARASRGVAIQQSRRTPAIRDDAGFAERGVRFEALLETLRLKLIVKSDHELRALMREFQDHKVLCYCVIVLLC
jgi:hypothetical protein